MAFLSTLSSLILLQWLGARVKVSVRKKINIGFHLLGQSNIHKNTWKTTHLIRRNGNFPIAHLVVRHRSNYFIDPKYKCLRPRSDVIECVISQNRINAAKSLAKKYHFSNQKPFSMPSIQRKVFVVILFSDVSLPTRNGMCIKIMWVAPNRTIRINNIFENGFIDIVVRRPQAICTVHTHTQWLIFRKEKSFNRRKR